MLNIRCGIRNEKKYQMQYKSQVISSMSVNIEGKVEKFRGLYDEQFEIYDSIATMIWCHLYQKFINILNELNI